MGLCQVIISETTQTLYILILGPHELPTLACNIKTRLEKSSWNIRTAHEAILPVITVLRHANDFRLIALSEGLFIWCKLWTLLSAVELKITKKTITVTLTGQFY